MLFPWIPRTADIRTPHRCGTGLCVLHCRSRCARAAAEAAEAEAGAAHRSFLSHPRVRLSECQRRESAGADGGTTGNSDSITIAVVDRLGVILAVWQGSNAPAQSPTTSARWSTRRTSRYRWLVRLHSSAMTRHRCRRAQCGSSVVFTSRRALRTRRAPICTASRIRIVGAPFRQTTFRAKLFRCPLCRPHDAQSSRYHHRQGRPNGSRRKRHGSDRRCSDCRMPWII